MDRKLTREGGYTVAPRGKLCTNHSSRRQERSPAPFLFLTRKTIKRHGRTHTCVHFSLISSPHKLCAGRFTHLNRGNRSLRKVKTKDPQLSQP